MAESTFDYIVVGAGSAGCVVASRLSEDWQARVLLLEAGGPDSHPDVHNPVRWPSLFYGDLDWGFRTQPLRHCNGRVDHLPRGKMLGGCHSHNANAWVRGHPADFDNWAYQGCVGWDWESILPLFQKIEDWQGPPCDLRGTSGPLHVAPPSDPNPIAQAFVEAAREIGLPVVDDHNGPTMDGATFFNLTIKDGKRFSVAEAYLRPAMQRENLTVLTHAETHRLCIADGRCTGVEFEVPTRRHSPKQHEFTVDGNLQTAVAESEVIVCAGVIGSPKLLLLSGIGLADELRALDIETVSDLPGVGRNLQDHPLLGGINYECKGELPEPKNNGAESTLWWRSDSRLPSPDIQPVVLEFPFATPELADQLPHEHCYALAPSVVRPASRGRLTLTSANPQAQPAIDVNFMARDADVRAMLAAVELCREMGASSAFNEFRKREIMPGPLGRTEMIEFIRQSVTTYFHPTSTCKMGVDDEAVVDPQLRVYGIEGLRVADASVMPTVTSGNTNAPTVMIGEKAAQMIREAVH